MECCLQPQRPEVLPCRLMVGDPREGDPMEHASYSINGGEPGGQGGGVLFWCYSLESAIQGALWCVENAYTHIRVVGWSQRGDPIGTTFRLS